MKKRVAKIVLFGVGALMLLVAAGLAYVKLALPNVGPAPELILRPTAAQIEHGRYLANHVAVCIDCHSERDFSKLTGPVLAGSEGKGGEGFLREAGFPGNFYARNITPAHLSDWTDGEIYRAITTGVSRDGRAMFPVMPYKNYGQMAPDDIKAIVAYVRSLKPIPNEVPASEADFPVNFIINTMPTEAPGGQRPNPTDRVAYGRYLTTFAACADCHTPRDDQGNALPEKAFSMPTGTVRSANITPARSGIGAWTRDAFIARFKTHGTGAPPPDVQYGEFNSVMPWTMYGRMTDEDLGAIWAYLRTVKPVETKVIIFTPKANGMASR